MSRRTVGLVFLAWTVEGLVWSAQSHVAARLDGSDTPLPGMLVVQLGSAYAWAVFTLAIFWLRRRFPLERGVWGSSLPVHVGASLAMAFVANLLFVVLADAAGAARPDPTHAPPLVRAVRMFIGWFDFNLLIYWIILVGSQAFEHHRRAQERELRAAELEAQLARARLDALEAQLHPHFLFNALNTIAALVRTGQNSLAIKVVAGLGELLRRALDRSGEDEIPLSRELELVERYLEIERIRFGDRLTVSVDSDPATQDARIPALLLQPLVENAVRHGLAPRAAPGRVEVRAWREDGDVRLRVRDDGVGLPAGFDPDRDARVGLGNTRERLERLYGRRHAFRIGAGSGGGVEVDIRVPFRRAADAWHGRTGAHSHAHRR